MYQRGALGIYKLSWNLESDLLLTQLFAVLAYSEGKHFRPASIVKHQGLCFQFSAAFKLEVKEDLSWETWVSKILLAQWTSVLFKDPL